MSLLHDFSGCYMMGFGIYIVDSVVLSLNIYEGQEKTFRGLSNQDFLDCYVIVSFNVKSFQGLTSGESSRP